MGDVGVLLSRVYLVGVDVLVGVGVVDLLVSFVLSMSSASISFRFFDPLLRQNVGKTRMKEHIPSQEELARRRLEQRSERH